MNKVNIESIQKICNVKSTTPGNDRVNGVRREIDSCEVMGAFANPENKLARDLIYTYYRIDGHSELLREAKQRFIDYYEIFKPDLGVEVTPGFVERMTKGLIAHTYAKHTSAGRKNRTYWIGYKWLAWVNGIKPDSIRKSVDRGSEKYMAQIEVFKELAEIFERSFDIGVQQYEGQFEE